MSKFTKIGTILVASAIISLSGTAFAEDSGADLYKAKGCAACHGADAKSPITPAYPKLAGQSKDYLIQQMTDIKNGKRSNGQTAIMKPIMASVTEDDIKALAKYLSELK